MSSIDDIELMIRDLIRINEMLVTAFDSELLCSDWENTVDTLKELCDEKKELMESLERLLNEFFNINQNPLTRRIRLNSFSLIPSLFSYEFKFNIPRSVNKSSREYFCYISLMDRLSREYDVISLKKDGYYILDITECLNIKKLFEVKK
ncbi:hypothetical protein [Methanobrevibacter sp.]|uniref:hypothetical protein n=1 Tax=Methanobrevibacter sp. TaxID=66852 RepID=UPI0038656FAE